ncbi:mitochondrial 54S ribosomal protein YmL35 [Sugiyamaella lignohabitans]|uniref:Large ribosomal subunit protein mL38 n=1 Tax=Sugiyamaella lignohabitans TaxID=796027 RepID=A0A167FBA7_9ASCO|nr:mitochondrial 54S ribosomal protein YmL35 [Sugiyamaella lignohabitans]ANB15063.1 mitochondrial 54S ribosomal protein YmL35 [Sugiyamaella lignohabitans]
MSIRRAFSKSIRAYSTEAATAGSTSTSSSAASTSTEAVSSLKIRNPRMRRAVLQGDWIDGPPSLRTKHARLAYNSPIGLKEVFPLAYDIILKEKARHYAKAEEIKQELESSDASKIDAETRASLVAKYNKHLVRAELNDPEVQYNYRIKQLDLTQPVYRHLAERDWKSYDMLITLQRLEQLHVIPDTLPTIDPRADVKLQFPTVINKWVTPGEVLRNAVCTRTPIVKIQEFQQIPDNSLYTVLIVDPDTPDIANDGYTTTLHWAVTNIPLSNTSPVVDLAKSDELIPFLPPHPDKNGPTHRYCLWAFRQADPSTSVNATSTPLGSPTVATRRIEIAANDVSLARENFGIRAFVSAHNLDPVGAHVWRCTYDQSTESVREKFGLGPGIVFDKVRR